VVGNPGDNVMSKSRLLAVAALVAAGALGVGSAQAQEAQVSWSITIGTPAVYPLPAPVFVRPAPVIVQPAVRYERGYQQPTRWDRDGDGIPNRYDRLYNPQWDRDGDGIPNSRDRLDNRRHDHDGDGIPNRHDRH
jgi:hypothetical protein